MGAQLMNPMNITSSFSNLEKMRRKPLSRRNGRSVSLRRLSMARWHSQGANPVRLRGNPPRDESRLRRQLPGLVAFLGAVHQQVHL